MNKGRKLALDILEKLEDSGPESPFLPELIKQGCSGLGDGEKAQGTALIYGFLRCGSSLDSVLHAFVPQPEKLPRKFRLYLRLAAWELIHGREAEHAVLHQWVSAAKARFGQRMAGLLNAVLRNIQKQLPQLRHTPASPAQSLPAWIHTLWTKAYGPEQTEQFARHAAEEPSPCYRINALRHGWEELRQSLGGDFFGSCGVANAPDSPQWKAAEQQGLLSRQGASSQMLADTLRAHGFHGPVWDACCGRGGKSLALLEAGCPVHWASDPHEGRLRQFQADLSRLGLKPPALFPCPAQDAPLQDIPFILLDAPCSGLGTLARNPELRLRLSPAMVAESVALQTRLLASLWPKLASGGMLAYATCALNPEENQGQIQALSAAFPDATLLHQNLLHPAAPLMGQDYLFLALLKKP